MHNAITIFTPKSWETTPDVGADAATKGFHSVTLTLHSIKPTATILTDIFGYELKEQEGNRYRFVTNAIPAASVVDLVEQPNGVRGFSGAGTNHHVALKVLILLHGRGGSAEDILSLADALPVKDFALFAPQAEGYSWYPYSFLSPPRQNEPWLSGALEVVKQLVAEIETKGIMAENIWFTGFSQGACLMLEFLARNARRYGGAAAFTGGLIGDHIYPDHYHGDFQQTPIFIGTGNPDPHVPVGRVHETTALLKSMQASVTGIVYPGMGHTISNEEIREAARVAFNAS